MPPKAPPKVKKAMNKPPAAATRSHDDYPGQHLRSTAPSSRTRAADTSEDDEDGESGEPSSKAAPKVEKAMDKPPADATRSHDAYPGEHLGSAAVPSSKRAADLSDDDEGDAEAKPSKAKASKIKKAKAVTASDQTKPSKVDGHPIETEKTHPGGDMVEVEPSKEKKTRKSKKPKEKESAPSDGIALGISRKAKPGKSPDSDADEVKNQKQDASGENTTVEATASSKPKHVENDNATDTAATEAKKPKAKAKTSGKRDKLHTQDGEEVSEAPEPAKKAAKSKTSRKGAKGVDDQVEALPKDESANTAPSKKGRKAKAPVVNDDSKDKDANIAPDMAMDSSVFDSLLSTDKGKEPAEEAPAPKDTSAKATKKDPKSQTKGGTGSKDNFKVSKKDKATEKPADGKEEVPSKSKKRKSPPGGDLDAVKADLLDPLSETASAKKKQKKSGPSAMEAAGESIGSLLSSVKKNAKAAFDFAGNAIDGGQGSLLEDITDVAEGVVNEKKKRTKKSKVPKADIPSEESLLKGLESSGDEKDPDEDEGFEAGKLPPPLPQSTFDKINARSDPTSEHKSGEGVLYVGRIPHGFYEHQMRAYFGQFGHINRLRLSRNKTSGASRHYAFVEFDSQEVAKIVEETMNNYLLFGHILKIKSLDPTKVDPKIWKGADRRFKKVPWAQIEGRKLAMPMSREQWEKRVEGEEKRRTAKAEKLKEIGYEFESSLKSVDEVPVKESKKVVGEGDEGVVLEEEKTLVTEPGEDGGSMIIKESITVKKPRKPSAKAKEIEESKEAASAAAASKKGKRKAEEVLDKAKAGTDVAEPVQKKAKKAKAKAGQVTDKGSDVIKESVAPIVEKVKETAEQTSEKVKGAVEDAVPAVKKGKKKAEKNVEDVAAPIMDKAKETTEETSKRANAVVEDHEPTDKKVKKKAEKTIEDVAVPVIDKAKETAEEASEKAKGTVEDTIPGAKKGRKKVEKTAGDVAAPTIKKSKKSAEDSAEKVKDSAAPAVKKGKEVVEKAAEATATATGTSKKGKKAKA